ncbi:HAMP domain-containing sensor histidine kinase [Pontimicrobium sp. SW4]|uniref:histidine kinase n=1 Tax=Pontimicrobium sp. SW4 TaxID=3153519 RepID=A0AAU7BNZ2_9FLAO
MLVILMSLSLVGIIFVQAYFINNTFKNEEEQFTFNVKKALTYTSDKVVELEYDKYVNELKKLLAKGTVPDSTDLRTILVYKQNDNTNQIEIYDTGVLEERFTLFDIGLGLDSSTISRFTGYSTRKVFNNIDMDSDLPITPTKTTKSIYSLNKLQMSAFETQYREEAQNTPIHLRVSKNTIRELLSKKLLENNIDIDFEFSIYHKDLATKVQSNNFELQQAKLGVPIFLDNNDESEYTLYINFPDRNKFILSSIVGMALLAIIFTVIIIIAYASALFQLIKQRQISQIKTDFINNMTHEFKTPIATINLALDAIRNPKIIGDEDKVKRYLGMIKDENKRMHAQVENVLRISKLEKNELNISKERVKLHDIINDAAMHIELIVEDRNGYVKTHLDAINCDVLANETHFTNVIVNILDNAVKYSNDEPKIDIYTENVGNNILLKIQDQGNGMSKSVQKRVFEKFYREHTGDVHNVKGHGLGLSYVKRIVEDHQGHVSVESEKGKGSTFIIKLPLIS